MTTNRKQAEAYHDDHRFQFWLAGRRGGKSFALKNRIRKRIQQSPEGAMTVYIGPTNQHAMELMWQPLEETIYHCGWDYKALTSKQTIFLPGRRKAMIIGAEKIDRIRGHAVWHAAMDEVAYFSYLNKVWKAVRPTLADMQGGATLATTPDGKGSEAHEFWTEIQGNPEWSCHHWTSRDNPYIREDEIIASARSLDEKAFEEEYEAKWVSAGLMAYYNFLEQTHIRQQPPVNPNKDLYLCFDFNVDPTTILVRQKEHSVLSYKKEYSLKDSSTEATIDLFCEDFKKYRESINIKIRGDASGRSRSSATGKSDYYYVEQILRKHGFRYSVEVPASNPPVVDRVKYLNGWLKPVEGSHRIEFDPSMKETIKDLSSQGLTPKRHPDPKGNLGHKADAVGYDVYYEQRAFASHKSTSRVL